MRQSFAVSNAGLTAAFGFLEEQIRGSGLDSALSHRLSVILDEICANMIRHDDTLDASKSFTLDLSTNGKAVEMIISDPGQPFNPLVYRHTEQPEIGGHGITLIKGLASAVSYHRTETENRLTVLLRAD